MTRGKLTDEQRKELRELYSTCSFTLDFIAKKGALDRTVVAEGQTGLDAAYQEQNLKGLRMARRDLLDWSRALSRPDREELEKLLETRLGVDTQMERTADLETIRAILVRGQIRDEEEYYLASSHLESLYDDPSRTAEARKLNELVMTFGRKS